jgi:hypothetical protein
VPTYQASPEFLDLHARLSPDQRRLFRVAVNKFVADLKASHGFRKGLGIKGIQGAKGMYEMRWADDGRAVFSYGESVRNREPHIIWHAIGTHAVLS